MAATTHARPLCALCALCGEVPVVADPRAKVVADPRAQSLRRLHQKLVDRQKHPPRSLEEEFRADAVQLAGSNARPGHGRADGKTSSHPGFPCITYGTHQRFMQSGVRRTHTRIQPSVLPFAISKAASNKGAVQCLGF
jgi:hypothetical protein